LQPPRSRWLVVPLVLLGIPALLALWFGRPTRLDPTACGALPHTPPLLGLTIPQVRAQTGWSLNRGGAEDTYWVAGSRAGLGRGGGASLPRPRRVGPLVLRVDAAGRVQRADCANWTGP
jgi:hypothetical protein